MGTEEGSGEVWFVYDGDCPICTLAANALAIRRSVGRLHLVDARTDTSHPLLHEIAERRLSLDDGMVLKYCDTYYHGKDALHMMALLGSDRGWLNRLNAVLFRSAAMAPLCYPLMRAARNLMLRARGVGQIRNLTRMEKHPSLFQPIFGKS